MSLPNTRPRFKPESAQPAEPFATRRFDFSSVVGLSTHALEVHRSLYEGYVKETNALLPLLHKSQSAELSPLERLECDGAVRRFSFEHNGMVLHELFFEALRGRSDPPRTTGLLNEAAKKSYGSYEAWQSDIRKIVQTRGVGWVLAVQSEHDARLTNIWVDEHSHGLLANCHVVLAIDVWEHAYLLDFKPTERLQYLQVLFDNLDWETVEGRCL